MSDYEKAMAWLNVMFCLAKNKTEEDVIKYIQEIVWRDNDMRNS